MKSHETTEISFFGMDTISDRAVAAQVHLAIIPGTLGGYVNVWSASEATEPSTSVANYAASTLTSASFTTGLGGEDISVKIANHGSAPVNVVIDLQGYYGLPNANTCFSPATPGGYSGLESEPPGSSMRSDPVQPVADANSPDANDNAAQSLECDTSAASAASNEGRLAGRFCFFGLSDCGWESPFRDGSLVHIDATILRGKLLNYHGLSRYVISRAIQFARNNQFRHDFPNDRSYEYTAWEYVCSGSVCNRTSEWVNVRWLVNWNDGIRYHGELRTMYCSKETSYMIRCPNWVKTSASWLGPIGPQIPGPVSY